MNRKKGFSRIGIRWGWLLTGILVAVPGFAQTGNGGIAGTVWDQTSARIPGVTLRVVDETSGLRLETVSNEAGHYRVPALPVGSYRVEALKEGFQGSVRPGVVVTTGQVAALDLTLAVNAATRTPAAALSPSAAPSPATARSSATTPSPAAAATPSAAPTAAQPAQNPAPAKADDANAKPALPPFTAGWNNGFIVQSNDGEFRLQIGLLVHADGRFALQDDEEQAFPDQFALRRLRPNLRGRIGQHFEFYLNPDFAGGTLVVQDAYFDTVFAPEFRIRVGKGKTPFGLERLHSASNLLFFERALPTALVPNRDIGVQVLGDISGGVVSYMAGVMNGVADGGSADLDNNDGKDVSGRLVVRPFNKIAASPLKGLGLGIAGSRGRQTGVLALPLFRTQSLQSPYFLYSGAAADGVRVRYSPQFFYYYKRFGGFGEYVHTEVPILKGEVREKIAHSAWQLAGSIVLTGETASDGGVRPRQNFNFGKGQFGAFQIAARYHALRIDQAAITLGLANAGASRKADAWTVGLNWYLTPNLKYVVNFERTVFDGDRNGSRKAENGLVFRTQVNF